MGEGLGYGKGEEQTKKTNRNDPPKADKVNNQTALGGIISPERVLSFFEGTGGHDVWKSLWFLLLNFHAGKENPPSGDFLFCLFFEKRKKS